MTAIETARAAARSAVDEARAFVRQQEKAAEVAAERALQGGLSDQAGAAEFCRALERLEKEIGEASRQLQASGDDASLSLEIPGRLDALRRAASGARMAWWPRGSVPASAREWSAIEARVIALLRRGDRGLREARQILETQPPVGWEEVARRILEKLPTRVSYTGSWQRLTKGPVLAGMGVAIVVVGFAAWSLWPRPSQVTGVTPEGPSATPTTTPPPEPPDDAPGVQAPRETAWIHAPFLASLTLQLESDGTPPGPAIRLPGAVTFPVATDLTVRLAWDSGGPREARAAFTSGGDLQAKVDELLAGVSPDGARAQRLDEAVEAWTSDILKVQP